MYVTDSLFFLQHLLANSENDENRQMFNIKYRELFDKSEKSEKQESVEEIQERIISKARKLAEEK